MEKIIEFIVGIFSGITGAAFGKEILIFIISLLPILELRGGLVAAALLNMDPVVSYIICVVANILIAPFILWFLDGIFNLLRKLKFFDKIITAIEKKCLSKREQIDKYGFWGLAIFIGIPLPGTGVWTGCFIASLIGMDKKKALLAAILGVIMASIIMMLVSFGILANLF